MEASWESYQKLILEKLKNLEDDVRGVKSDIKDMRGDVQDMKVEYAKDISELKVKAGVAGAALGFIVSVVTMFAKSLFTK